MDLLEKYTKENKAQFDDMEPSIGHTERFAARLSSGKRRQRKTVRMVFLSIASAAAVIALFVLYLIPAKPIEMQQCSLSPELVEVNQHYSVEVECQIEKIKLLAQQVDGVSKQTIDNDIKDMREESGELLQQLCSSNADEEERIFIVVQHYEQQINALQTTISALQNARNA